MSITSREPRGQVIILVALALIALVAVVALAVDVGHIYGERRRMQNAADAGALAGAREICFNDGTTSSAVTVATDYAVNRNGAEGADVTVDGGLRVTVVATETAQTFFAGVIGLDAGEVSARAVAACNKSVQAGNIWPLSVEITAFQDLACTVPEGEASGAGEYFHAFVDNDKVNCDECVCDIPLPGGNIVNHLDSGEYGWLRMFVPPEPYDVGGCNINNCGKQLDCWLDYGHPGPVSIGDCIPGNPGVDASVQDTINGEVDNIYNLVLFDRQCGEGDPESLGTCPGTPYRVAGFGCVRIHAYETKVNFPMQDGSGNCSPSNNKVVIVQKMCGEVCESDTGSGTGDPDADDVRSVSLIE